jgi:hypothetical protein
MLANGVTDPENPVRPTNGLAAYPLGSAVKMARCAPERKVKLLPPPHRPPVLRLLRWLPLGRVGWCGGKWRVEWFCPCAAWASVVVRGP